mmetsp:Transcript_139770/g.313943  ORF Transcript_139770/g.313943 Transcript_139770/m.313943 type:complete len:121 (+) Transcript_139770:280-642(+)
MMVATVEVNGKVLPGLDGDPNMIPDQYYVPPPEDISDMYVGRPISIHENTAFVETLAGQTFDDLLLCNHGYYAFLSLEEYNEDYLDVHFKAALYNPTDTTDLWFDMDITYDLALVRSLDH